MDELLHHWQISLISQGRAWVDSHKHIHPHHYTHTHTHMERHIGVHKARRVWVCGHAQAYTHTHALYQSNLIGKSMLWLANRELMQSRGLSSPLPPPVSIFTYLSLSCPSPLLSSPLCLFLPCFFFCGQQQNNTSTRSTSKLVNHGRQTGSVTILWFLLNFYQLAQLFYIYTSNCEDTGAPLFRTFVNMHTVHRFIDCISRLKSRWTCWRKDCTAAVVLGFRCVCVFMNLRVHRGVHSNK